MGGARVAGGASNVSAEAHTSGKREDWSQVDSSVYAPTFWATPTSGPEQRTAWHHNVGESSENSECSSVNTHNETDRYQGETTYTLPPVTSSPLVRSCTSRRIVSQKSKQYTAIIRKRRASKYPARSCTAIPRKKHRAACMLVLLLWVQVGGADGVGRDGTL